MFKWPKSTVTVIHLNSMSMRWWVRGQLDLGLADWPLLASPLAWVLTYKTRKLEPGVSGVLLGCDPVGLVHD